MTDQDNKVYELNNTFIILFIFLLTIFAYNPVVYYGFNYDDKLYIINNSILKNGVTLRGLIWAFSFNNVSYWHPLSWLSLMFDVEIAGLNPYWFHIHNIFLHLINVLLIFKIFTYFNYSKKTCAIITIIFAIHPVNVESVVWIVERKNLLSGLFFLLTIYLYIKYILSRSSQFYILALISFAIGLLAKPKIIMLPLILFLFDLWPLKRIGELKDKRDILPLIIEKIPFIIFSCASVFITIISVQKAHMIIPYEDIKISLRISNAIVSYFTYIVKMVYPVRLGVFYPYPDSIPIWKTALSIVALILITFIFFKKMKSHPYVIVGWLFYIIMLLPALGLMQAGRWPAIADRFLYIPSFGLFLILGGVFERYYQNLNKYIIWITIFIVISVMIYLTKRQVSYWRNDNTLFLHTLSITKNNYIMHNNVGVGYLEKGRWEEAEFHFRKAILIKPDYEKAYYNLGNLFFKIKRYNNAIQNYKKTIRIMPSWADAWNSMGCVYEAKGDDDKAIDCFRKALAIDPKHLGATLNLSNIWIKHRNLKKAIDLLYKAIVRHPYSWQAYNNLGNALYLKGELRESIYYLKKALNIEPESDAIHYNLANSYLKIRDLRRAKYHYEKAIAYNPKNYRAYNNLGIIHCYFKDIDGAIRLFKKAIKINPKYKDAVYNLNRILKYK